MSVPVFIADPEALRAGDRVRLDGDEGRHAAVVRRIGVGERVDLTDGAGHVAQCVVSAADRTGITCDVESRADVAPPAPRIVVVQALPKGERGETAVETLTEVGVDEIVPWSAARCVTRWKGERGEKALRRWRSTSREAAKQSRRAWLPRVGELASSDAVAARFETAALGVVLHEEASVPLTSVELPAAGDVVVAVGPEGGVSPEELESFTSAGAVAARLGPTVLRTSTAGTVAAGVLLSRTPRWP
ncbi:16S rRNA (uracil(1498)-N(3))-methyltransferase [Phytoactinopolyspora alkaliphila]|uniref:Ribosomal RNA small subunit methyltransferase E n=1 Tax=Phytoactinopolyspora alkaliphila TaxID=1783498 RepID=A0A6N9YT56_9ACTN|nr:16S rRNA (uracil(1498)-N(3))-methyltransferase [Phytoactinopolyspora alkaliphila]NED98162.1 16S rRNA (uracil(1498)-N(3))-methyltransferase [Phytoactinopolyspora alkaliphila]